MISFNILISLTSFMVFLILHLIIWRTRDSYRGVNLILILSVIVYPITTFLISLYSHSIIKIWLTLPIYYCLIILYVHLYIGLLKSVSIRILEELYSSPNFEMTRKEIENIYPVKDMVLNRLSLLEENNWIEEENGSYRCLKKAIITAKVNLLLHKIYRLKNTG